MAAPHVSGAAALLRAKFPNEDVEQLIIRILQTAQPIEELAGITVSGARLNLVNALSTSGPFRFHDDFDGAMRFQGCYGFFCGSNKRATRQEGEDVFSPDTGSRSLWFSWKAPTDGLLTFLGGAATGDLSMVAFKGTNKLDLFRVVDNFPERSTKRSTFRFYVRKGEEYRFSVDSRLDDPQLMIAELILAPENDMVADAALIDSDRFVIESSNCGSTAESFEIERPHAGVGKGNSVWWKWTPTFSGEVVMSTAGSQFDTVLAVYSGSPGSLLEVGSNDDRDSMTETSEVMFDAVAGSTYYIVVDAFTFYPRGGKIVLSGSRVGELLVFQQPLDQEVPIGQNLRLDVGVLGGEGKLTYQWAFDGAPIAGENGSELFIPVVQESNYGQYQVAITSGSRSIESEVAVVTEVLRSPVILDLRNSIVTTPGENVAFRMRVEGTEPMAIMWFKDGIEIAGKNGPNLEFPNIQKSDSGFYRVEVSNIKGVTERWLKVVVVDDPDFIWSSSRNDIPVGGGILDIESMGSEWFALSGRYLLSSPNGLTWSSERIPASGEILEMVASDDSVFIFSKDRAAIYGHKFSNGGWTELAPRLEGYPDEPLKGIGTVGLLEPDGSAPVMLALTFPNSLSDISDSVSPIATTQDGVIWKPQQWVSPEGVVTKFPLLGNLCISPRRAFALPSATDGWDLFASENGVDWEAASLSLAEQEWIKSVHDLGDHFLAHTSNRRIFKSTDGLSWQELNWAPIDSLSDLVGIFSTPGGGYAMITDENIHNYVVLSNGTLGKVNLVSSQLIQFEDNHTYHRAGGEILIGTNKGRLVFHSIEDEFNPEPSESFSTDVVWAGGQFIFNSGEEISSDGIRWKANESPEYASGGLEQGEAYPIGFARDRYWMSFFSGYSKGRSPLTALPMDALPSRVSEIVQIGDVVCAMLFSGELYFQADQGGEWVEIPGIRGGGQSKLIDWNDRLIVSHATDGIGSTSATWQYAGSLSQFSVGASAVVGSDGSLYTFSTSKVRRHTLQGAETEWQIVGLPPVSEIMAIDRGFLAITAGSPRQLYFSRDGVAWLELEVPFHPRLPAYDPNTGMLLARINHRRISDWANSRCGPVVFSVESHDRSFSGKWMLSKR